MLLSGQMNQYHNADTMDRVLRDYLEGSGRFDVTLVRTPARSEDMSQFAPDFGNYDVVVLNYDGDEWPETTKQAFEDYMQGGGGLVTVHSSDNAFAHWHAFLEMTALGGWNGRDETWGPAVRWVDDGVEVYTGPGMTFHPPPHDYLVTIRDPQHPITAGLPTEWLHAHDELYSMLRGPAKNMHILATGFADPSMQPASRFHEPVLFTVRYGEGRIFHTTLGHVALDENDAPESVRCVGFATTLLRGAEWAATGNVTLPLPDALPDARTKKLQP
jgi:type 1 glutamine amidotransferase